MASEHGGCIGRGQFARDTDVARDIGHSIMDWIINIAQSLVGSGRFCMEPGWITHFEGLLWFLLVNADRESAKVRLWLQNFIGGFFT